MCPAPMLELLQQPNYWRKMIQAKPICLLNPVVCYCYRDMRTSVVILATAVLRVVMLA